MTVGNSSRPIARVFRATAAPGCRDELVRKFHSSSAALVNSKVGCLKYRVLEPADASAPEVVFESIWRGLDAVKVAFGDAWQQSQLPEGYSALMTAYSVHHFFVNESSTTSTPRALRPFRAETVLHGTYCVMAFFKGAPCGGSHGE